MSLHHLQTPTAAAPKLVTQGSLELALAAAMADFCEGGEGDRVYARDHRDEGYAAAAEAMQLPADERSFLIEAAVDAAGFQEAAAIVSAAADLRLFELEAEAAIRAEGFGGLKVAA